MTKQKKDDNRSYDEIHKAVAQAWHSHFNNEKLATCEFDLRRRNFQGIASRFKLEAMRDDALRKRSLKNEWRFKESLWDSYEIVSVSKKLETGLIMGYSSCDFEQMGKSNKVFRKRKESKNSLRNLFNDMSSRRFNDSEVSSHETTN